MDSVESQDASEEILQKHRKEKKELQGIFFVDVYFLKLFLSYVLCFRYFQFKKHKTFCRFEEKSQNRVLLRCTNMVDLVRFSWFLVYIEFTMFGG